MNKYFITIAWILISSCGSKSQNLDSNVLELQKTFNSKNETEFLKSFPENYDEFVSYFGWNENDDMPSPLYEESTEYINYFFYLLKKEKYESAQDLLINIGINGRYQADAVNYFIQKTQESFSENPELICKLLAPISKNDTQSYAYFYLDSPQPLIELPSYFDLAKRNCATVYQTFQEQLKKLQTENVVSEVVSNKQTNKLKKINEFIPPNYFILDSLSGYINMDSYADKILVLADINEIKNNKPRVLLVLLNNTKDGYTLAEKIENAIPCYRCAGGTGGENSFSELYLENKTFGFTSINISDSKLIEKKFKFKNTNSQFFLESVNITSSDLFNESTPKIEKTIEVNNISLKNFDYRNESYEVYQHLEVKDPDGFTNLRAEPNTKSEVLKKIKSGEKVELLSKEGAWCFILTNKGLKGYIHESRLK